MVADAGRTIAVSVGTAVDSDGPQVVGVDLSASDPGTAAAIDAAIARVSTARGELGAPRTRFGHYLAEVGAALDDTAASESRIRDTRLPGSPSTPGRTPRCRPGPSSPSAPGRNC